MLTHALNTVARVRAEHGDAQAFRLMQQQAMRVGQRLVELRLKMSALETARAPGVGPKTFRLSPRFARDQYLRGPVRCLSAAGTTDVHRRW